MTNGAATLRIKDVIEYFPLPDKFKILLLTKMSSIAHPILGDKSVLMFCIILTIFNDSNTETAAIRYHYLNMLK